MNKLINIGYGNYMSRDRIVTVVRPDSAPVRRMIQTARDNGTAVDATQGRKTKGVIVTDTNSLVLSALLPDTIAGRCQEETDGQT